MSSSLNQIKKTRPRKKKKHIKKTHGPKNQENSVPMFHLIKKLLSKLCSPCLFLTLKKIGIDSREINVLTSTPLFIDQFLLHNVIKKLSIFTNGGALYIVLFKNHLHSGIVRGRAKKVYPGIRYEKIIGGMRGLILVEGRGKMLYVLIPPRQDFRR